jgi:hypothetical protein
MMSKVSPMPFYVSGMASQPPPEAFNLSAHLKVLIDDVKGQPDAVLRLRKMGVLFFDTTAAFHLSVLSAALVVCRGRFAGAFRREGWDTWKTPISLDSWFE